MCIAGQCDAKPCTVGQTVCSGPASLDICKPDETGFETFDCASNAVCDGGACKALVCAPGESFCDGTQIRACAADGLSSSLVLDCAVLAKLCSTASGQAACSEQLCAPGSTQCSGDQLQTCASDGQSWLNTGCPDLDDNPCTAEACDAAQGQCVTLPGDDCDDGDPCTADAGNLQTGACVHDPIGGPGCCVQPALDSDCDDGDSCTTDSCGDNGVCGYEVKDLPGCCDPTPVQWGFEQASDGNDRTFQGTSLPNVGWQVWPGATQTKAGTGALYYGNPAAQNFQTSNGANGGTALSPAFIAPAFPAVLQFSYYLDVETGVS